MHKDIHFSLICNNQKTSNKPNAHQKKFASLWHTHMMKFHAAFKTNEGGLYAAIQKDTAKSKEVDTKHHTIHAIHANYTDTHKCHTHAHT